MSESSPYLKLQAHVRIRTRGLLVAMAALLAPLCAAAAIRIEYSFARFQLVSQDYGAVFTAVAIDQSALEPVLLEPRVHAPVGMEAGSRAYAANDLDDFSTDAFGVEHSFTIIPEPGSLSLLALRRRAS
jgi:hypothetical protein